MSSRADFHRLRCVLAGDALIQMRAAEAETNPPRLPARASGESPQIRIVMEAGIL